MKPKRIKWIDPHLAGGGETLRNPANVAVLADKMRRERGTGKHPWPDDLPPLFVYPEPGVIGYFVLDGNHRLEAALEAGLRMVPAVVVPYRGWARLFYDEGWPRDEAIEKLTGWDYPLSWRNEPESRRVRQGIWTSGASNEASIEKYADLVGVRIDAYVARLAKVSEEAVAEYRRRRGIQPAGWAAPSGRSATRSSGVDRFMEAYEALTVPHAWERDFRVGAGRAAVRPEKRGILPWISGSPSPALAKAVAEEAPKIARRLRDLRQPFSSCHLNAVLWAVALRRRGFQGNHITGGFDDEHRPVGHDWVEVHDEEQTLILDGAFRQFRRLPTAKAYWPDYRSDWDTLTPEHIKALGCKELLAPDHQSPGHFEKAFKAWLRSEAVYKLADKHAGCRRGCTWAEGWCFALAEVLHRWGGWPTWVVMGWVGQRAGRPWWQTEHVVVWTPWGFLDGAGFRQRAAVLRAFRWSNQRGDLQLLSAKKAQEEYGDVLEEEGGEAAPPAMVRALLRRLRKDFGKPEDWGLVV